MTNSVVLFSVFGDPTGYKKVSYRIGNSVIPSYTSTKALCKAKTPKKTVVFVSFTLYHKLIKDITTSSEELSYSNLLEEMVEELLKIKAVDDLVKECSNVEFVVSPGVGMFSDGENKRFYVYKEESVIPSTNKINLYFNHLYYKVFSELSDYPEVYVDLTHGINYMPIALYDTVNTAVMAYGEGSVYFYNSDPLVTRNDNPDIELNVNEINATKYESSKSFNNLISQFLSKNKDDYKISDIDKMFKLARATQAGVYIFVYYFKDFIMSKLRDVETRLAQIENMKVKIKESNNVVEIVYQLDIPNYYYLAHGLLYSLSKLVNYEKIDEKVFIDWIIKYATPTVGALIEEELVNRSRERRKAEECYGIKKRNFIAHVGLLDKIADVKINPSSKEIVSVKYKNEKGRLEELLDCFLDFFDES